MSRIQIVNIKDFSLRASIIQRGKEAPKIVKEKLYEILKSSLGSSSE